MVASCQRSSSAIDLAGRVYCSVVQACPLSGKSASPLDLTPGPNFFGHPPTGPINCQNGLVPQVRQNLERNQEAIVYTRRGPRCKKESRAKCEFEGQLLEWCSFLNGLLHLAVPTFQVANISKSSGAANSGAGYRVTVVFLANDFSGRPDFVYLRILRPSNPTRTPLVGGPVGPRCNPDFENDEASCQRRKSLHQSGAFDCTTGWLEA